MTNKRVTVAAQMVKDFKMGIPPQIEEVEALCLGYDSIRYENNNLRQVVGRYRANSDKKSVTINNRDEQINRLNHLTASLRITRDIFDRILTEKEGLINGVLIIGEQDTKELTESIKASRSFDA